MRGVGSGAAETQIVTTNGFVRVGGGDFQEDVVNEAFTWLVGLDLRVEGQRWFRAACMVLEQTEGLVEKGMCGCERLIETSQSWSWRSCT